MDEAFSQDVLDDQTYLLDSLSGHRPAHTKQVGDIAETAGSAHLYDGDGHILIWS